jgi:predicted component of type VI protein secretion system
MKCGQLRGRAERLWSNRKLKCRIVAAVEPESQQYEWKKSLSLQREGMQSLCGMINADCARGVVAFGVGPDGEIVGVEPGNLDRAQLSLSQLINNKFEPSIQCDIRVHDEAGKKIVVVSAERNRNVPYHEFDGRAYIREGTATRQLSLSEKQNFQRKRNRDLHPGPWKCDRCGSWVGMLISMVVTDRGVCKSYSCGCGGEYWPA